MTTEGRQLNSGQSLCKQQQQRLEFIKKQIDDVNKFQSAFKTKEDKYRRLLGVDQEELEAEKNMLESSMNKNDNSDAKKAAEKKVSIN